MPDFDLGVTGLASPPAAAPVTSYRPALSVRNNGIATNSASGQIRIYHREPPGALIATLALPATSVAAGATATLTATAYWIPTPDDIGKEFVFTGDIFPDRDTVEPNDHLAPVTVIVTGAEPPPPPPVTAHAAQHESGGADEIGLSGMHGVAADPQRPLAHHNTHEAGEDDALDVSDLPGLLAQPQTPATHQNEAHGVAYLTGTAVAALITAHDEADDRHADDTGLEHVANKGTEGGYCPLDGDGEVPTTYLQVHNGEQASHPQAAKTPAIATTSFNLGTSFASLLEATPEPSDVEYGAALEFFLAIGLLHGYQGGDLRVRLVVDPGVDEVVMFDETLNPVTHNAANAVFRISAIMRSALGQTLGLCFGTATVGDEGPGVAESFVSMYRGWQAIDFSKPWRLEALIGQGEDARCFLAYMKTNGKPAIRT